MDKWLGEGRRKIVNEHEDMIFQSKKGLREIRFDLNKYHPHDKPHIHLIIYNQIKDKKEVVVDKCFFL
jgi:hypothetical protein